MRKIFTSETKPMTNFRFLLYPFLILALTACAAPDTPTPTVTPEPLPTAGIIDNAALDPALGNVQGSITWLLPNSADNPPVPDVTFQLDRHSGEYLKYKVQSQADGYYVFANIEPGEYGFGVYLNLKLDERSCGAPEFTSSKDLQWVHYSTWSKVDVWYDIIFSEADITVKPGETVTLDFQLKCP